MSQPEASDPPEACEDDEQQGAPFEDASAPAALRRDHSRAPSASAAGPALVAAIAIPACLAALTAGAAELAASAAADWRSTVAREMTIQERQDRDVGDERATG